MAVDLLVFGPHPDDLEIGAGRHVARHAALGLRVGLCDLTAGEMGSNGTVEERLAEAEAAREVLGAAWRENLRWPDRRIGKDPGASGSGRRRSSAGTGRASSPSRTGRIAIPITSRRARVLTEAVFNSGLRRYQAEGDAVEAGVDLLLLHQRQRRAVVRRRRVGRTTSRSARRSTATSASSAPATATRVGDASEHAAVPAAHREPRRAVRRAGRRRVGRGRRRARAGRCGRPCSKTTRMKIGIVCYASVGGSGIVATELGKTLAARGHDVHVLSSDTPFRLGDYQPGLSFHRVETPTLSAVPRAAVPAVAGEQDRPGVARRAARHRPRALRRSARDGGVPGAADSGARRTAGRVPTVITTLHGTDITLLGSDPLVLGNRRVLASSSRTA